MINLILHNWRQMKYIYQEFPYEEQFELVEIHLQMLDGNGEVFEPAEKGPKDDEDEEWSSCESSDNEMES